MRIVMQCFGALLAVVVIGALLLDEGEVVTLIDHRAGRDYETQLWIVELDGRSYLRARDREASWLRRLGSGAHVQVRRARGSLALVESYRAAPARDAGLRERVDAAMAEKYGLADLLWSALMGGAPGVPVALDPVTELPDSGEPDGRDLRAHPQGAALVGGRGGWV